MEWPDYFQYFENVASWNGWTDEDKACQLAIHMKGEALSVLGDLPFSLRFDYRALVQELNRRFNPPEREAAWKLEFRNRQRSSTESVMTYAYDLKKLANKAFPRMSYETRDLWVMDQFQNGLSDKDMKRHVQFGHPKSLHEAISLAVEFEAFEGGSKGLRKPKLGEVCNIDSKPTEVELLRKEITSLKNLVQNKIDDSKSDYQNKDDNNRSEIECFYCKKKGHIKRYCRKLKAKLESEAANSGNSVSSSSQTVGN